MTGWPWPNDTALQRARRVARSYRDALESTDPNTCDYIDTEMRRLGQAWVLPTRCAYQDDDWLSADHVADLAGVSVKTVYEWRRRGLRALRTNEGIRFHYPDVRTWLAGIRG